MTWKHTDRDIARDLFLNEQSVIGHETNALGGHGLILADEWSIWFATEPTEDGWSYTIYDPQGDDVTTDGDTADTRRETLRKLVKGHGK